MIKLTGIAESSIPKTLQNHGNDVGRILIQCPNVNPVIALQLNVTDAIVVPSPSPAPSARELQFSHGLARTNALVFATAERLDTKPVLDRTLNALDKVLYALEGLSEVREHILRSFSNHILTVF